MGRSLARPTCDESVFMPARAVTDRCCPHPDCPMHRRFGAGNIVRHGFFKLKRGPRRRRYRCTACGRTFASSQGTPYHKLQRCRATFDAVATMGVEGVSKASIARIMRLSWNTVARWLERAAEAACRFNARMIRRGNSRIPGTPITVSKSRAVLRRESWRPSVACLADTHSHRAPRSTRGRA